MIAWMAKYGDAIDWIMLVAFIGFASAVLECR